MSFLQIAFIFLQTFADWGIDMIKLDGCNSCTDLFKAGHEAFKFYINQTRREMLYSCEWPSYLPESKPKVFIITTVYISFVFDILR